MKSKILSIAVVLCALVWAISGDAEQPSAIHANDHGEFTITQPTKAGDVTLQPGTYAVQHHTSKGKDVIRFLRLETKRDLQLTRAFTGWVNKTELVKVADIPVDLHPVAKAPATTMMIIHENGVPRITQVTIKGNSEVYDLSQK